MGSTGKSKNSTVAENTPYNVQSSSIKSLSERLSGDALLDAEDLIDELKANGAEIDGNGYVTLYHRTNANAANSILNTGFMTAKEDGLFFSTEKDGQAEGFGKTVLLFKIPVEKLVIDDEFGNEAHVRIPLPSRNTRYNIKKYLIGEVT